MTEGRRRKIVGKIGKPGAPIKALHLVHKHDAGDRTTRRKRHLKRIVFTLRGHRHTDGQGGLDVVSARRKHQEWTTPSLLPTTLRIEREPYEMANVGNVEVYQRSALDKSSNMGAWRFSGVMRSMSSASARDGALRT